MKQRRGVHRLLSLMLPMVLLLCLAACSSESPISSEADTESDRSPNTSQTNGASSSGESEGAAPGDEAQNILIAYFTVPLNAEADGADAVTGASRMESDDGTVGNVRFIANVIQKNVGGDLFSIETVQEYPVDNIDKLLEFAYEEKAENARPELATHIDNLDDYDVIFIGYPNWNADLPMPLYTSLRNTISVGKQLFPLWRTAEAVLPEPWIPLWNLNRMPWW